MKEIVIISHEPLTSRNKTCFFIDEYRSRGITVHYWDASQYFFPGMKLQDELNESIIVKVNTLAEIESQLKKITVSDCIFIVEVNDCWENRAFYRLLDAYRCYEIYVDMYGNSVLPLTRMEKIKKLFSANVFQSAKKHLLSFLYKYYKKRHGITTYRRLFSSSSLVHPTDKINHPDYENFRDEMNKSTNLKPESKYIVFIDTYFPYHPDLEYIYKIKKVDGKTYQASLNRFFSYLEKKYQMPVRIAAHPKANYNGSEFEGRQITRLETNKLVISSEMVVLHASNAISYVALANKKVVFITTDGYNYSSAVLRTRIKKLAALFGKKVYNIDKVDFERIDITPIAPDYRERYIYSFLTDEKNEKRNNIDILLEAFSEL